MRFTISNTLIICVLGFLSMTGSPKGPNSIPSNELSESQFVQGQDSSDQTSNDVIPDTESIDRDSLEKILPYLEKVETSRTQYLVALYMGFLFLLTLFSEELACIGGGLMAANGMIPIMPVMISVTLGILFFNYVLFFAGRIAGISILEYSSIKWLIRKEMVERSVSWFQDKGPVILILSRFIPGSRIPAYLSAGILRTSVWTFSIYFGLTVLIWSPLLIGLSKLAGGKVLYYFQEFDEMGPWVLLILITLIVVALKIIFWRREPTVDD